MEVTINIKDEWMEGIRRIGQDEGNLDYFVDGYYWGDDTDACEQVIVAVRKAVEEKQAKILAKVSEAIMNVVNGDWMTLARIRECVKKRYPDFEKSPEFEGNFSTDLYAVQCRALIGEGKLEHQVIEDTYGKEFTVCRKPKGEVKENDNPRITRSD